MVKKKSVLVVDDHPLVREGLKVIIGRSSKFEVVGEAGAASEGFRMVEELKPDLVLLDISLPDESGIELTRRIKRALPESRILIVSMHSKIDYITEAFKAGATGYMVKESAAERLLAAMESVATGEHYLDSPVSHSVIHSITIEPPAHPTIRPPFNARVMPDVHDEHRRRGSTREATGSVKPDEVRQPREGGTFQ